MLEAIKHIMYLLEKLISSSSFILQPLLESSSITEIRVHTLAQVNRVLKTNTFEDKDRYSAEINTEVGTQRFL